MHLLTEYDAVLSHLEELPDALNELAGDLEGLDDPRLAGVIQNCRDLAVAADEARFDLDAHRTHLVESITPESDEVEGDGLPPGRTSCPLPEPLE